MIHAYRALPYRSSFLAPHLVLGMFALVGCSKESGSLPEAQDPQQIAQPPAGLTTPDTSSALAPARGRSLRRALSRHCGDP
jgi:hypothetical protein